MSTSASSVIINTGNVLNLIDIKKKAGQNVTEELSESIKLTLSEWKSKSMNGHEKSKELIITRATDDAKEKMAEEERKNFKIGVKIFINSDSIVTLKECLDNVFSALNTESIDNVILAYNPPVTSSAQPETTRAARGTGSSLVKMNSADVEAENEDALKCDMLLPGIKVLWLVLEDYVKQGRVSQLGVADTGGGCLRRLHAWARVRPSIAQINLASCCVVPPALHTFCKANHVQLLTHADPPDLLSAATSKCFVGSDLQCEGLEWCARYQVHIKCRGVLALKGYVCRASVKDN